MKILLDNEGTVDSLKRSIEEVCQNKSILSVLVLSCDENQYTDVELNPFLQSLNISIFGGIFPQIIYGRKNFTKGNIIVGLEEDLQPVIIENLSSKSEQIEDEIEQNFLLDKPIDTMFVFVDGFSSTIATLIDELFNYFGLEHNYIGGGAGSLTFIQKPCIYTNRGLLEDAATIVATNLKSGIGVKHGWKEISGPYQITKSNKNIIEELDYKPAFEVYKEVIEANSNNRFNENNFFDIAKGYPFGISKIGSEKVVRDPITTQNGSLICVGELHEGDYVDILMGENESLINAAKDAYIIAKDNYKGENMQITFFIDCISRVLFLGDDFKDELNIIPDDFLAIGALTLGEIANSGQDYLEFYNKTSVVCVL
jgi:hypothetical protein